MKAVVTIIYIAFAFVTTSSFAWETDNITCRSRKIEDSADAINKETNERIKKALKVVNGLNPKALERYRKMQANRDLLLEKSNEIEVQTAFGLFNDSNDPFLLDNQFPGLNVNDIQSDGAACSKSTLENMLASQLASPWMGNLETWAMDAPISKCTIPVSESVFQVLTLQESMVAKSAGINSVININGHKIGVDKLSHFMTEGLHYHLKTKDEQDVTKKIKNALAMGIEEEEGGYGWQATGVKSYGDMSANYKGYTFWSKLYDQPKPYFICEENKWKQVREFDWRDYVDDSLDESINCNEFKTAEMNKKIDAEVGKRWKAAGFSESACPASAESCAKLTAAIYNKEVRKTILHPRCSKISENSGDSSRSVANPNWTPTPAPPSYKNQYPSGGAR